jgi:protein-S-isoprenylcysteine O-methyltransferase Ste14
MLVLAVGVMMPAVAIFRKEKTTLNPTGKPSKLVDMGPFKMTRNPMYLGLLLVIVSFALFRGEGIFLVMGLVFFLVMDKVVIPEEEAIMKKEMGKKYEDYMGRVRRWI